MNDLRNNHPPPPFASIWNESCEAGFAMASEPLTGSLLRTLAASKRGAKFLELGSGTGLSTAWLLGGMDAGSTLLTVDNDPSYLSILKRNLGDDPRLTVVCADADAFVTGLRGQTFDFIFADTWAGKYRLLQETLELLTPGGFYVVDDMLPQPNWPAGHAQKAAALVASLESSTEFRVTKLSWASGLILATKVSH
jgi:predicted O-methyltransferase YrrM